MMKCRLIIFVLIIAVVFTCGCFGQQQSVYVQDKYITHTFGGTPRYYITSGINTYECADSDIYDALGKGGTYTVIVNTGDNRITKVIS